MSVKSVTLIKESGGRAKGSQARTRVYQVELTDAAAEGIDDALAADDGSEAVPQIGDEWKSGSSIKAVSANGSRMSGDQLTYQITVQYSDQTDEQNEAIENPLNRPAEITTRGVSRAEPYFTDADDEPVANSAGELFSDLPEREVAEAVEYQITKFVSSRNTSSLQAALKTLNNSSVTIDGDVLSAGQAFLSDFNVGPKQEKVVGVSTVTYYKRTVTVYARADWDDKFEDRGLNGFDISASGVGLVPIRDSEGGKVATPFPLDGLGFAKAAATDTPAEIVLKPYERSPWPSLA